MSRGSTLRAVSAVVAALIAVVGLALLGLLEYSSGRARHLTAERYRRLERIAVQLDETADALHEAFKSAGGLNAHCPPDLDCAADSVRMARDEDAYVREDGPTLVVTARAASTEQGMPGGPTPHARGRRVQATTPLSRFVDRVLRTHDLGGEVLLTTRAGRALYQNHRQHLIRDLEDLLPPGGSAPDAKASATSAASPRTPGIFDLAGREDLSYAGVPYRLFVVPVSLRVLENDRGEPADEPLYLCNLVPISSLRAEQLDVSPLWIVALAFVLVLVLLAWPVLKLRFMGPRDRLRGAEIRMLVLAALLGSGIATFSLLAWDTHLRITMAFDDDMEELATLVAGRFTDDVQRAYRLLRQVAERGGPPTGTSFHALTDLLIVGGDGKPRTRWKAVPAVGDGKVRWAIEEDEVPPGLHVEDRRYFHDVQAGRFWALEREQDAGGSTTGLTVEAVVSRRTAQFVLVIATPMRGALGRDGSQALIGATMPSFDHPTLAPGLSFAVVDRGGDVQLHSTTTKNLNENVLEDCDDDLTLRALLQDRRRLHFDARCSAGDQRLFVTPLAGTPWSIVVMRGERIWQETVAELALVWMTLYGGYLLGWLALLLVVLVVDERYQAPWLWPRRELAADYLQAAALLAVTAFVFWWAAAEVDGAPRAMLVGLLPVLAVAFLAFRLDRRRVLGMRERLLARLVLVVGCGSFAFLATWRAAWWLLLAGAGLAVLWLSTGARTSLIPRRLHRVADRGESGFRMAYVSMLTALLVTVAVVPAAVLFGDARQYVLTAFVKLGNLEFAEALDRRAGQIWGQVAYGPAVRAAVAREEIADPRDVYTPNWLGWRPSWLLPGTGPVPYCELGGDPCPDRSLVPDLLSHWTLPLLPPLTKFTAEIRQATCAGASDGTWCWVRATDEGVTLDPRPGSPGLIVELRQPPEHRTVRWLARVVLIAACVALAFTVFGLLWMLARIVFLLDADPGARTSSEPGPDCVGLAFERSATPATVGPAIPHVEIDLRTLAPDSIGWVKDRRDVERGAPVTLQHLEAVLDDPERSEAALRLVSALARGERALTLTSAVDPVRHLGDAAEALGRTEPARRVAAERLLVRWAELLARFERRERREPLPSPAPPDHVDHARAGRNASLWTHATPEQRLAMRQLAEEGYLNPGALDVARELLLSGRVRRTPTFALHDPAFRRFVLDAVSTARLEEWEREGGPSAWARLQMPLLVLVLGLAAVVFVLQPQMLQSVLGVATGVSAAVPILMRMFSALGNQGTTRAS